MSLQGKVVVVGVTGGIAAYKVGYVVSGLRKEGAEVHVLMTESATRFVGPLTFRALSQQPVLTDMWDPENPSAGRRIGSRIRSSGRAPRRPPF